MPLANSVVRFSTTPTPSISVSYSTYSGSVGAVFLAPSGKEGLALVVAGTDISAQQSALLAFPYRTGVEVRKFSLDKLAHKCSL